MSQHRLPDFSGLRNHAITIYCWSRTQPQTELWAEAERLGKLAVEHGFSVITGGYCGSMEAVSKGAREALQLAKMQGKWKTVSLTCANVSKQVTNGFSNNTTDVRNVCVLSEHATLQDEYKEQSNDKINQLQQHKDCDNGNIVNSHNRKEMQNGKHVNQNNVYHPEIIGVVVSGIFPDRVKEGNRYLTVQHDSTSMMHRIEQLTSLSRYYIVMPGTLGTLQQLCCIWVQKLLHPSTMPGPLIVAYRHPWEACLRGIAQSLHIPEEQMKLIRFVDNAEEAIRIIYDDDRMLHASTSV